MAGRTNGRLDKWQVRQMTHFLQVRQMAGWTDVVVGQTLGWTNISCTNVSRTNVGRTNVGCTQVGRKKSCVILGSYA
jgi:hypothetical protein